MSKPFRERCIDMADESDSLLFADGYDEAIVGIAIREGVEIVVYDSDKVIRILRRRDGMSVADANEFFDFNIGGAWVGERTPLFLKQI